MTNAGDLPESFLLVSAGSWLPRRPPPRMRSYLPALVQLAALFCGPTLTDFC